MTLTAIQSLTTTSRHNLPVVLVDSKQQRFHRPLVNLSVGIEFCRPLANCFHWRTIYAGIAVFAVR